MNERLDAQSPLQTVSTATTEADGHMAATAERGYPNGDGADALGSRDAYLRQILTAILAFREGDFSVRLPADWSGIEGRVAEAFNQTISQEDRIAQEISGLSELVGKEGRLKRRSIPTMRSSELWR